MPNTHKHGDEKGVMLSSHLCWEDSGNVPMPGFWAEALSLQNMLWHSIGISDQVASSLWPSRAGHPGTHHTQSQPVAVLSAPLHSPNAANHYCSQSNASCSLSCLACLFRAFVLHLKLQDTWKGLLKSLEWCVLFFQQGLEILSHLSVNWTGRLPFFLWQLNNGVKLGKTRDKKLRSLYRLSSCTELCTVLF